MPTVENDEIIISHEVQEIISNKPAWVVRNGILMFLMIIAALITLSFFISYPDVVHANAKLTSINAPKEVKAKADGKLIQLHAIEGKFVEQNEIVGFMESMANHEEMIHFSKVVDSLQILLSINETEMAIDYFTSFSSTNPVRQSAIFPPPSGEIEGAVQTFMQSFNLFRQYLSHGYYLKKKRMLTDDIRYLHRLHTNLLLQKNMQQEDVALARQTLDANKSLDEERVISPLDYRNEKSRFIGKSLGIPQILSAIIGNESSRHEKQKEIAQLENEIAQQKEIFVRALNTLKAELEEWKNKYLLVAPIEGRIAFARFLQENMQLKMYETVCFINPENSRFFAEITIPQNNFGKIKQGQKVLLKLPAYPYPEFGAIEGRLDFISNIPSDSGYLAKVVLPQGLQTNYKIKVQFREGLLAQGEIITADTKLFDRVFNQFKLLSNN